MTWVWSLKPWTSIYLVISKSMLKHTTYDKNKAVFITFCGAVLERNKKKIFREKKEGKDFFPEK